MYHSTHTRTSSAMEAARVQRRFQQAQNPLETGVVPRPAYADMFGAAAAGSGAEAGRVETLAGQRIAKSDFTHNNMMPFFGGSVKGLELSKLESFEIPKKQEVLMKDISPAVKGLSHVCGQVQDNNFIQSRIVNPTARNNEFPIAQQNTSVRLEGADLLTYLPNLGAKTVDEIRVKPRVVTEGRQASGAKGTVQPAQVTFEFDKNRPETFYEQSDDYIMVPTRADTSKPAYRSRVELQDVHRGNAASEYAGPSGPAGPAAARGLAADPEKTDRILPETQPLGALPVGHATLALVQQAPGDDYGKANVQVYCNERTLTTTKTVQTNLTAAVKAAIAPLLDILKPSRAEFTLDAARPYGALQAGAGMPEKPTTYDPVLHMPRTTIKETLIHDTTVGNLRGSEPAGRDKNPEAPLPTVRNTLVLKEEMRNLRSGTFKVTVFDPSQVARTTHRETMSTETRKGHVDINNKQGAYTYVEISVPNTQKQFVSDHEYQGNAAQGRHDGYRVVQYTFVPAPTQKQFVSDHHYVGSAGAAESKAQMSAEMWEKIKNKAGKEELEMGRAMTASGAKQAAGKEAVKVQHISRNPALQENPRPLGNQRANEGPRDPGSVGSMTKQRGLLETSRDDRLDTQILSAFYDNPYTKPLNSVA